MHDKASDEHKQPVHKSFMARHEKIITLLGALILFFTFIVKDNKREAHKELVARIADAQTVYGSRNEMVSVMQTLQALSIRVADIVQQTKTSGSSNAEQETASFLPALADLQQEKEICSVRLDMLGELASKLPGGEAFKKRINDANALIEKLDTQLEASEDNIKELVNNSPSPERLKSAVGGLRYDLENEISQTHHLMFIAAKLRLDLFQIADTTKQKSEHRLKWYSGFSIALYIIGWALALVAKLFGAKSIGGTE
jgi:hypothetical protein